MEASQPAVLVVDDHLTPQHGMELVLREAGFAVTVCGTEPGQAAAELRNPSHDVALIQLRPRFGDGLGLAREALKAADAVPLVLCTAHAAPGALLVAAAGLGAPGLILSSSSVQTLLDALRGVAAGGRYEDPEAAAALESSDAARRVGRLSPREREVLELLVDGLQGPEIAARLFLSLETVRTHIRNAVAKLDAQTRVQAAAMVACDRWERLG
jgi:DNA-binding NarL/FixJ family response regulator